VRAAAREQTWRGWTSGPAEAPGSVTSARLSEDAHVRNRMFPKTRSWFALGGPVELLSPLSVARTVFALAALLWALELAGFHRSATGVAVLAAAVAVVLGVWCALLAVRDLSPRSCRALAVGLAVVVDVLVHETISATTTVGFAVVLVPLTVFVALYLGLRRSVEFLGLVVAGLWVALIGRMSAGPATAVALVSGLGLLTVSSSVSLLARSVWRGGLVDPETGLPNALGLAQRLSSADGTLTPGVFCIIASVRLVGVDDARQALGHPVGTELLRRAVEDLGQVIPAPAFLSRVDADDLVVALVLDSDPEVDASAAPDQARLRRADLAGRELADAVAGAIGAARYLVDGIEILLQVHVGLVFAPWDGVTVAELVRRSSLSAQRAAAAGQVVAAWDGDHDALTADDLGVLADLRLAADRGELWLAYQPQVSADSGRIVSVEALLRWDSPAHGQVPPGRFIILAERTGFVDRLTQWVLDEALDAQVRWQRAGVELPVAVNLSAKTLARPEFATWILAQLERRGLSTSVLTVEVTETAAASVVQAEHLLRPLHDRGIRVSIDDFGKGYTSMAAIPHWPLDEIKVDMDFVKRAPTSLADEAIVRSVRELAHRLHLTTVAEGVEDDTVSALMTEIGFDLLQGYHFAKPMPEHELVQLVTGGQPTPTPAASATATGTADPVPA
jgi:diguanylate cyclase